MTRRVSRTRTAAHKKCLTRTDDRHRSTGSFPNFANARISPCRFANVPKLSLAGIQHDGSAEPSRYGAATPPPCRAARQPQSALAPPDLVIASEQSRFATNTRMQPNGGYWRSASTEEAAHFFDYRFRARTGRAETVVSLWEIKISNPLLLGQRNRSDQCAARSRTSRHRARTLPGLPLRTYLRYGSRLRPGDITALKLRITPGMRRPNLIPAWRPNVSHTATGGDRCQPKRGRKRPAQARRMLCRSRYSRRRSWPQWSARARCPGVRW
jgi:hypothetical protein